MNSRKLSEGNENNSAELYLRREGIGSSVVCIPITSKKIRIGCDERRSTVSIQGKKISRSHCEIRVKNRSIYVTDCRSRNGTFVNEKRVKRDQKLKIGDRIGLGTNPYPLRHYDEHQFVYSLCRTPRKVILDEINVEVFSFIQSEPDLNDIKFGKQIADIIKSLEEDSDFDLSKDVIDMNKPAIFKEASKCKEIEMPCLIAPKASMEKIQFKERENAVLWDKVDLSTETYQPHLKQLTVKVKKITDIVKFIESARRSLSRKRKKSVEIPSRPKKAANLESSQKVPDEVHKTPIKLLEGHENSIKTLYDIVKSKSSKKIAEAPLSLTSKTKISPKIPIHIPKNIKLANRTGSPHPRSKKFSQESIEMLKLSLSKISTKPYLSVISKSSVKKLKSILKNTEQNARKKNLKVTFCNSVYIKEIFQDENEFDHDEP